MHTKTTFKLLGASLISLILTACGGGDGSSLDNTLNGTTGVTSSSSSSAENADTLQTIEFKDATPAVINLIGTGGAESSLVRFRTLGQTGQPIKNIAVNFALTSTVGNLKLSQDSGISDKDGYVSTSVVSGTVSTSVRVTATVKDNNAISTQSSQLVIATGLPDQKSMSLSLEKFNPAGWGHDGVTSRVNILLADAYNNPAADGTVVYFTTEGGSIGSSCVTIKGACNVNWTSQSPRPGRDPAAAKSIDRVLCLGLQGQALRTCEAERAGRSTILATAVGNESFKDQNGNGIYDPKPADDEVADPLKVFDLFLTSKDSKCTPSAPWSSFESMEWGCDDLAEAYLDANENGVHDKGEYFINFITDTSNDTKDKTDQDYGTNYTPNNGIYNGAFCQAADEAKGKCSRSPVTIRKQHMVVMSCDDPLLNSNGALPAISSTEYPGYTHAVADCNGNALPLGSTITVGSQPAIKIGNQYGWTPIIAASGDAVKLSIAVEGATKDVTYVAE